MGEQAVDQLGLPLVSLESVWKLHRKAESVPDVSNVLNFIEVEHDDIFLAIKAEYGIDKQAAKRLYQHLWIYTHGIATLCVTKTCTFTEKEIESMLYEVGESLLRKMKVEE